jgi:hypothetical protein
MNNTYKSHKQFFQILTKNKLNELLNRADKQTQYLETELNTLLPPDYKSDVKVLSEFDKKNKTKLECSIYINFFKGPVKIGHYSFHLYPEKKNIRPDTRKNGRLHIKNNVNSRFKYVLDIQKQYSLTNQTNYLQVSLDKSKAFDKGLEKCVVVTQTILNNYFNPNHETYLGNHLTFLGDQHHKCFNIITSSMNKAKIPMRNTRKIKR